VTKGLAAAFPAHKVIGEEAAAAMGRIPVLGADPTWIVDPIDGTQNFTHGCPLSVRRLAGVRCFERTCAVTFALFRNVRFHCARVGFL